MAKTQDIESNQYIGKSIAIDQIEKRAIFMTSLCIIVPYDHVAAYQIESKNLLINQIDKISYQ